MSEQAASPDGDDRDEEIRATMAELGVTESEAAFIVAMARGEIDGDIVADPPLTPEERERMGIDRRIPPLPVLARS